MNKQFERVITLLGEDALKHLQSQRVLVAGLGGVGSYAAESLIRSGIGALVLADYDVVEESNLNRQLQATRATLGQLKTEALKERLLSINPDSRIETFDLKISRENIEAIFEGKIDYVVDAIDDLNAKILLWEKCRKKEIPFVSSLGMARRLDASKICITTLNRTSNDPMARKLRHLAKQAGLSLNVKVVWSLELPLSMEGNNGLGSLIFVPASAGLLCGQACIEEILGGVI